jgi:hypothetical protein
MLGVMTRDDNGTKLIGLPLTGTHKNNPKNEMARIITCAA